MRRIIALQFCLLGSSLLLWSCSKSDTAQTPTTQGSSNEAGQNIVFRDSTGRELTESDMASGSGNFDWSIIGTANVSEQAKQLHKLGRDEGQKGNYAHAIELLKQASDAAPAWPYPVYDAAFTGYKMLFRHLGI